MHAHLFRLEHSAQGVLGVLTINNQVFCATLELPDLNNAKNVSCIPAGVYICMRVQSPRFGNTFEVTGVENRSHILFHKGNTIADTQGCIILGQYWDKLRGNRAVLNSGLSFQNFIAATAAINSFPLMIHWVLTPPISSEE
jgi:hypothetical protein